MRPITLASRDSLLALAQTIEAALMLKKGGFSPRIMSLKTSGDLKLAEPLYSIAQKVPESEGKAFFTKELDDALLRGDADAAVHSLKDIPAEILPGLTAPTYFSEVTGSDMLILRNEFTIAPAGENLVIGTSSLRRIHQLGHIYPAAETVTLRGNIVTRLMKLCAGERGMNAILIAGAGLIRLENFAKIPPDEYRTLVDENIFEKIQSDLRRYREFSGSGIVKSVLPEKDFPTAPGQGVLAFQFSEKAASQYAGEIGKIFSDHSAIASRVVLERQMMTELKTGCHAPLGISAEKTAFDGIYAVSLCFSRESSLDAATPTFADSIYLRRFAKTTISDMAAEIRLPFATAFWWGGGLKKIPAAKIKIHAIDAIKQSLFEDKTASRPAEAYAAVFASSPAVIYWLKKNPDFAKRPLWAAGSESAAELSAVFPDAQVEWVRDGRRGFAAAYEMMRVSDQGPVLWLGSLSGEARARRATTDGRSTEFLPIYDNVPVALQDLQAQYPLLADPLLVPKSIHLVTSASAAGAFLNLARIEWHGHLRASCFGESAAEYLIGQGYTPYHLSEAETFAEYMREISGDIALMGRFMTP